MTVSTLRPNGTTDNTGALTGGATAHAVLSDNSDASYVALDSEEGFTVTLGDFTLPADAVLKSVAWRLRTEWVSGSFQLLFANLITTGALMGGSQIVSWASPTTTTISSGQTEYQTTSGSAGTIDITDALIDATSLGVSNGSSGSARVHEAYVDVTYVTQPVVTVSTPTGTVTTETSPDSFFTVAADSSGGTPTHFEVKVFTSAVYGGGGFDPDTSDAIAESGITAGGFGAYGSAWINGWAHSTQLPDGAYRTYARAAQTVNGERLWSDWDFEAFTMDVIRPLAPTMTLTADDSQARVEIELEGSEARTNLSINPKAGTDTTNWTNTSLTTFERVTSLPTSGGLPAELVSSATAFHAVGNANADRASRDITLVDGTAYVFSVYARIASLSATGLTLRLNKSLTVFDTNYSTVSGNFARLSVYVGVVNGGGTWTIALRQNGAGAIDFHFLGMLIEEYDNDVDAGAASASPPTYFDGDSDNSAWTGTAELSTSTQGVDTDAFYVESSADGGGTWTPVRTGDENGPGVVTPVAGAGSTYDYEGPNGTTVQYRASSIHLYSLTEAIQSEWATDSEGWEDTAIWLKDPANPQLNVRIP